MLRSRPRTTREADSLRFIFELYKITGLYRYVCTIYKLRTNNYHQTLRAAYFRMEERGGGGGGGDGSCMDRLLVITVDTTSIVNAIRVAVFLLKGMFWTNKCIWS